MFGNRSIHQSVRPGMRNITYQGVDDHLHRRIGTSSPANLSASVWLVSRWPSHQSPYGLLQRTRARLCTFFATIQPNMQQGTLDYILTRPAETLDSHNTLSSGWRRGTST